MAAAIFSDLRGIQSFDATGDGSTVSIRWKSWIEEFEAYVDSRGLFIEDGSDTNKAQRKALLSYMAGATVRETFKTLSDTGTNKNYDKAVKVLNDHYVVKTNATYQRHIFRKMSQGEDTIAQFFTKLKKASDGCEYGADLNNQIRNQVVGQCNSDRLRRKLLERGDLLTLNETLKIAATYKTVRKYEIRGTES
ncbi:uncharacterized protein LOC144358564 [Saccoglossus kowalevskii]